MEDIWQAAGHAYRHASPEQGACFAIRDGQTDVCSGSTYHDHLLSAVANGVCARADVDLALAHTFELRLRLGLFDPVGDQPYWHVGPERVNTTASQASAWLATLESLVLLKHDGATLPLSPGRRVAVIGPHANATTALVGNYLGQLCPRRVGEADTLACVQPPLAALAALNDAAPGGVTRSAPGCGVSANDTSGFAAAAALAAASDVVILALGIDQSVEGESRDRASIDLPPVQHALVAAVTAAVAPGTRVVAFLLNGGPVDVAAELANPRVGAVLAAGYPGVRGAAAVAATLYGANDHLGGKLSYTVYPAAYAGQIAMSEMEWDAGVGRSHRYYAGPVVLPFGHGLALTSFALATVAAPAPAQAVLQTGAGGANLTYTFAVTNTGAVPGDEVVQLYALPGALPLQPASRLLKELLGYRRVHLAPGATAQVTFSVGAAALALADKASGDIVSTPGAWTLRATNGVASALEFNVTVAGPQVVLVPFPAY